MSRRDLTPRPFSKMRAAKNRAFSVACPKCWSPVGARCRGVRGSGGQERFAFHEERHQAARAAIKLSLVPKFSLDPKEPHLNDTLTHPLVRGNRKRLLAYTLLKGASPWPSASTLAAAVGWAKSTAAEFISAVRLHEGKSSGSDGDSGSEPDDGPDGEGGGNAGFSANPPDGCSDVRTGRSLPKAQKLLQPINKLSLCSDYVSEPGSLRSPEPETSSGAPMRAEQPRFDFNHAEEHRADLLKALVWDHGLRLLTTAGGLTADAARTFLGKRVAEVGRERLAKAIAAAIIDEAIEPKAYLGAVTREGPSGFVSPHAERVPVNSGERGDWPSRLPERFWDMPTPDYGELPGMHRPKKDDDNGPH